MCKHNIILPDSYLTLASTSMVEIKIQRSRFIALSSPASDEISARKFIAETAKKFYDSRHVCHGWRLGLGNDAWENRNDDGEPSGTAGEPILAAIRRTELTDVVVCVVRYFGGIKLGTGGLGRAYGGAADQVLEVAPRKEVLMGQQFIVEFPYAKQKTILHLLGQHQGKAVDEQYGAAVNWTIWVPHSTASAFLTSLTEATAGTVIPQALPDSD